VELDIITATPPPKVDDFMTRPENLVFFPLSENSYDDWKARSKEDIRAALRAKVTSSPGLSSAVDGSDASTLITRITNQTKQSV
jgi:hypothetical protein